MNTDISETVFETEGFVFSVDVDGDLRIDPRNGAPVWISFQNVFEWLKTAQEYRQEDHDG